MDRPKKTPQWRAKSAKRLERFSTDPAAEAANSLGDFGFVSKGDNRLKDYQNQEEYHKHVTAKYLTFCGTSGGSDALESQFAQLAITPLNRPSLRSKNFVYNDTRNAELTSILLCMRKLREGIIASRRTDHFAIEVFKQHIRAAILVQQTESYLTALLHLLHEFHPVIPLPGHDVQEFAAYYMLHLAARVEDYSDALAVKREFAISDRRALQAVSAMIHGNYWSWKAARNRVDQYMGRIMDFAEDRMRKLMLKCIGASYFTVELGYLEVVSGVDWEQLQETYRVGWELDPSTKVVTVKRPKARQTPG